MNTDIITVLSIKTNNTYTNTKSSILYDRRLMILVLKKKGNRRSFTEKCHSKLNENLFNLNCISSKDNNDETSRSKTENEKTNDSILNLDFINRRGHHDQTNRSKTENEITNIYEEVTPVVVS